MTRAAAGGPENGVVEGVALTDLERQVLRCLSMRPQATTRVIADHLPLLDPPRCPLVRATCEQLGNRRLVTRLPDLAAWRITAAGREALITAAGREALMKTPC
jgi:hypothetical protein